MKSVLSKIVFLTLLVGVCSRFRETSVRLHNYYRGRHGSPSVHRDLKLDRVAQNYANYLARTNQFKHSNRRGVGENLYMYWGGTTNKDRAVKRAIKAWYDEIRLYNYGHPGFSMKTGHFTQLVWKNSRRIGTGVATVRDLRWGHRTVVVVNYANPGNYAGRYRQNVKPPRW